MYAGETLDSCIRNETKENTCRSCAINLMFA